MPRKILRADWPRVRRETVRGKERFIVDSRQVGFRAGRREYWHNAAEAIAQAEAIARTRDTEGTSCFYELSPRERRDASEALSLLADYDASLLDAARVYIRQADRDR